MLVTPLRRLWRRFRAIPIIRQSQPKYRFMSRIKVSNRKRGCVDRKLKLERSSAVAKDGCGLMLPIAELASAHRNCRRRTRWPLKMTVAQLPLGSEFLASRTNDVGTFLPTNLVPAYNRAC